jgi:multiple sugar transport system substrate-binding protein
MKNGRIVLIYLFMFVIGAFSFAGGSQDQKSTVSGKNAVILKFVFWGSDNDVYLVREAIAGYEKAYPWVSVDGLHLGGTINYEAKIATMVAGNQAPDVAYIKDFQALELAKEGKMYNILDFLKNDPEWDKEDFLDQLWYFWDKGKTIGINEGAEAFGLFYNKDLFERAGVELPPTTPQTAWNWQEFVDVLKTLTVDVNGNNAHSSSFDPNNVKTYGIMFKTWWAYPMNMVYSNGADYLSADGKRWTMTDPAAYEAYQMLADLIHVHHVCPTPAVQQNMAGEAAALKAERVAMVLDGQWRLIHLVAEGVNFGVGVLPTLKKSVTELMAHPYCVFADTKCPEESWLLYKWLANPESPGIIDLVKGGQRMPVLKEWYKDPAKVAQWAENNPAHPPSYKEAIMKQALENGVQGLGYYVKNFAKLDSVVSPALDQVWLGTKTAKQVVFEIADQVNSMIEGRYPSE